MQKATTATTTATAKASVRLPEFLLGSPIVTTPRMRRYACIRRQGEQVDGSVSDRSFSPISPGYVGGLSNKMRTRLKRLMLLLSAQDAPQLWKASTAGKEYVKKESSTLAAIEAGRRSRQVTNDRESDDDDEGTDESGTEDEGQLREE